MSEKSKKGKQTVRKGKKQWVFPVGDKWVVRGEGNSRNTRVTDTRQEAIDIAIRIARNQGSEIVIQGRSGESRDRDSYRNGPFPPDSAFSASLERSLQENRDVWEELAKH
jgi:hypothetical protein